MSVWLKILGNESALTHEREQMWSSHHSFFLERSFQTILTTRDTAAKPVSVQVMARISDPRFSDSISTKVMMMIVEREEQNNRPWVEG